MNRLSPEWQRWSQSLAGMDYLELVLSEIQKEGPKTIAARLENFKNAAEELINSDNERSGRTLDIGELAHSAALCIEFVKPLSKKSEAPKLSKFSSRRISFDNPTGKARGSRMVNTFRCRFVYSLMYDIDCSDWLKPCSFIRLMTLEAAVEAVVKFLVILGDPLGTTAKAVKDASNERNATAYQFEFAKRNILKSMRVWNTSQIPGQPRGIYSDWSLKSHPETPGGRFVKERLESPELLGPLQPHLINIPTTRITSDLSDIFAPVIDLLPNESELHPLTPKNFLVFIASINKHFGVLPNLHNFQEFFHEVCQPWEKHMDAESIYTALLVRREAPGFI